MPSYNLMDLATVIRSLGRGVVFRAPVWTPADGPLELTHLGDTEGDIVIETNPQVDHLTTPELTGAAPHESDYSGEGPVLQIPMFLADPDLEAIVSPFGFASAGLSRRSQVAEHTLVIFPEGLFVTQGAGVVPSEATLAFAGGAWTLGGEALSAARQAMLGNTFWAWRGAFTRPTKTFHGGAGDARKNIETATFTVMHHPDMPEGHKLYTIGNPFPAGINLDGAS
jgi:hypothetical protein